ncbi:hypothetical protein RB623_06545 [Mesorhizobium sp. LHD-90]|uniref:hypothetical protein n=1 Tax=Mesorhizobium sp. LHD-90 TaxID=3071414 RepID=UPI0027E1F70F|nr:hypothetical protein [Mesorhizobium sp. LHD-90]MDQ6433708.1 hypothetical protein [Mesorhizobium sp. LHD-90]
MADRVRRLKKLLDVQEQLKALHETRHAGFVASAVAARAEAEELAGRFDAEGSLAMSFPDVYHRRISAALSRERASQKLAETEAGRVAMATVRADRVERAWREADRADERGKTERDLLELLARKQSPT